MRHTPLEVLNARDKRDTRLRAAAPKMLRALHSALSVITHLNYMGGESVEQREIVAAIKAASAEEPIQ